MAGFFVLGIAVILTVLSIFLFQGKGSWMIAGYNTMSEKEQSKYDIPKLCKATGGLCVAIAILLIIMAVLCFLVEGGIINESIMKPVGILFAILLIASVLVTSFYVDRNFKRK